MRHPPGIRVAPQNGTEGRSLGSSFLVPPARCEVAIMTIGAKTREQLEGRLRMLEARLEEVDEILRQPEDQDLEERANEWDDDDILDRLASAMRDEIGLIRDALKRMDDGSYGICWACGEAIGRRRLRVLPQATTCVRCAHLAA
jgi:RNA polymerase-binding transcription factor DksA